MALYDINKIEESCRPDFRKKWLKIKVLEIVVDFVHNLVHQKNKPNLEANGESVHGFFFCGVADMRIQVHSDRYLRMAEDLF